MRGDNAGKCSFILLTVSSVITSVLKNMTTFLSGFYDESRQGEQIIQNFPEWIAHCFIWPNVPNSIIESLT